MSESGVLWVVGGAVAIIVWAVRIEGRVNAQETNHRDFRDTVLDDLRYIRERIDKVINGR